MLDFSRLDAGSSWWAILPGLILGGLGMSLGMTPTTTAAMHAVPVDKAGVGSAVINSMRQIGGSLGIAILGAVVATQVRVESFGRASLEDFVRGYHDALYVGAFITFAAAFVAALTIREARHTEARTSSEPVTAS